MIRRIRNVKVREEPETRLVRWREKPVRRELLPGGGRGERSPEKERGGKKEMETDREGNNIIPYEKRESARGSIFLSFFISYLLFIFLFLHRWVKGRCRQRSKECCIHKLMVSGCVGSGVVGKGQGRRGLEIAFRASLGERNLYTHTRKRTYTYTYPWASSKDPHALTHTHTPTYINQ